MEKFKTPKLLITDHYDEVIKQVDIYIEELLENCKKSDIFPPQKEDVNTKCLHSNIDYDKVYTIIPLIEGYFDPYKFKYEYEMSKTTGLDIATETILLPDYLNIVRSKAIYELKKSEQKILDRYEMNKHLYKYNRNTLTEEKVEEIRRNLFKDNFSFVLQIDQSNNPLLRNYTVITDFYLDETHLLDLRRICNSLFKNSSFQDRVKNNVSKSTINENEIFRLLVNRFIVELIEKQKYGTEIIKISKSSIFEMNRVIINNYRLHHVYLSSTSSIDLAFIKSLTLGTGLNDPNSITTYEIRDLSGLVKLEYLQIEKMILVQTSFNGLHNLINLSINACRLSSDKRVCFDDLANLRILVIEKLLFPVELSCLVNLKYLSINEMKNIDYLINISENINILELSYLDISINRADEFFARFLLPNLVHLNIKSNQLPYLKEEWFSAMKGIKELKVDKNHLESLDFCQFACLNQLEKLDLSFNRIDELKESDFANLKRLKYLYLNYNHISDLKSNVFQDLTHLEYLSLNNLNYGKKNENSIRIVKNTLNGLTSLKELCISGNNLEIIDLEVFDSIPNLSILEIGYNKLKMDENIFANLKHLKKIRLCKYDLENISKNLLESLINSNIKICRY